MVETDGAYRTDDMCLAVVLSCAGFQSKMEQLNSTKVVWAFSDIPPDREEELEDIVDAYAEYGSKVEPRAFLFEYVKVRSNLFAFLDAGRRPVAPSRQRH